MIDEKLLSILACPACEDRPSVTQEGEWIVCSKCGRKYPVIEGIPEMIINASELTTPKV